MKLNIKGLVFVGFAAAVFAGAANADTTVTSKTYVDSKYVGTGNVSVDDGAGDNLNKKVISVATAGSIAAGQTGYATGAQVKDAIDSAIQGVTSGAVYQAKSTEDFQIGTTGGVFRTMTADEQAALGSGITSTNKVTHSGAVGGSTQPVYVAADGTVTATGYTVESNVPSNAVFTDTTYEADGTTITRTGTTFSANTTNGVGLNNNNLVTGGQVAAAIADATGTLYTAESGSLITVDNANHTIGTNAQANVIETVQVNGTALTPDANKAVNVTVPTTIASFSDAGNYELVSNKVNSVAGIDSTSTDTQYPSAKAVYNAIQGAANGVVLPAIDTSVCNSTTPCALVLAGSQPTWQPIQQ